WVPDIIDNIVYEYHNNIFMWAISSQDLHLYEFLIHYNLDLNKNDLMFEVIKMGNLDIIKWFMCSGFSCEDYGLLAASQSGNLDCMKFLFKKKYRACAGMYEYAIKQGKVENLWWLLKNKFPTHNYENGYIDAIKLRRYD